MLEKSADGETSGLTKAEGQKDLRPSRRDFYIDLMLGAASVAGLTAFVGLKLPRGAQEVDVAQLTATPDKFHGQRISTVCTLERPSIETVTYNELVIARMPEPTFAFSGRRQQECQIFRLSGVSREDVLVAVNVNDNALPLNEPVRLEGFLSEADINDKPVFVLRVRQ